MVNGLLCYLWTGNDGIFKGNHITIYKRGSCNDSCGNRVIADQWNFIHTVWILHGIFLTVSCTGKRAGRLYFRSLSAGNLLCTRYFNMSTALGNKRYSLCAAGRRCAFRNHYNIYGVRFTSGIGSNEE